MNLSDKITIILILLFVTFLVAFTLICLCRYCDKGLNGNREKRQRDQEARQEVDRLFRGWGESQSVGQSGNERSGGTTQVDSINHVSTIQTPITVHSTDYDVLPNQGSLYYNSHLLPTQVNRSRNPSPTRFPKPTAPNDEPNDLPPSYDFAVHNSTHNLEMKH